MKNRLLLATLFFALPSLSFADYKPILSIGGGWDSIKHDATNNITIISPFQNTYVSNSKSTRGVANIFLGTETVLTRQLLGQIGISYSQTSTLNIDGNIFQFTDPTMNNLNYSYNLQSKRWLVDTKLLFTYFCSIYPYLTLGAGQAINRSSGYQEFPTDTDNIPMVQGFEDHTQHSFAYEAGVGFDVNLSQHIRLGAGYRYVNLGKARLGTTPLQDGNQTIHFNDLHANELLLQLTYAG